MAIKMHEGYPPCRINFDEPVYSSQALTPPPWLEGLALEHWAETVPLMVRAGAMTEADRFGWALACQDYDAFRRDPQNRIAKDRYLKIAIEYGLTPSSRSRIRRVPAEPRDRLGEFLANGGEKPTKPAVK
jgi:phage terminase small subunit